MHIARIGLVIAAALLAATPAMAQQARPAAEIVLVQGPAQSGYRVLGEVRAEIHQKSIMAKTPARDLVDKQLRDEAAKLGADAVVEIKYENNSPMFSKKGYRAAGKAVKFETMVAVAAPVAIAPVAPPVIAAPTPAPVVVPPAPVATVPVQTVEAAPPVPVVTAPAPVIAQSTPPPAPVAPPNPAPQASVPGLRAPAGQALIVLTEDNLAGRAVTVLGLVEAEAHQTSLFPKKTARDMLEEDLRAKAFALGADAVISIKFDMNSPMLSKKGSRATGVAVKFQ
ncbi:MAG: hypothetical protein Q8R02_02215 [Hyphomonadaceae bacterium]|nr:hypothetical protein [Hyphomonadaceae bacterium]